MRVGFFMSVAIWVVVAFLAGCSFQVGIDWNGKTDKSNTTESPSYRKK